MRYLGIRSVADRDKLISSLCLHFNILVVKAELDQLLDGLKELGVLGLIRDNPNEARHLFVHNTAKQLTADKVFDLFVANLSPLMSNARDTQEAQVLHWANFLQLVEGIEVGVHYCSFAA